MQDFKKLDVWRRSHELAVQVFQAATVETDDAYHGLLAQLRRLATMIPTQVAEGCGCAAADAFVSCLERGILTANALEYHLLLARDLGVIPMAVFARLDARTAQTRQMLAGLRRKVLAPAATPPARHHRRPCR